jgi:hypothetical protein
VEFVNYSLRAISLRSAALIVDLQRLAKVQDIDDCLSRHKYDEQDELLERVILVFVLSEHKSPESGVRFRDL